jgi:pimeloyl-ACP methyl ester carboxylesterase
MDKLTKIPNTVLHSAHRKRPFIYDARYLANGKAKPVVIFIHGFKGFKDWGPFNLMADEFAREGFVFVKTNVSHDGTTPENPTEFADLEAFGHNNFSIELDDIGTLIDHIAGGESPIPESEADLNTFLLVGHSRGGAVAILKAAEDERVKGLATWASIHDIDQRWPDEFIAEWKEKGVQYIYNARTGQQMPLYYQLAEDYYHNKKRLDIPSLLPELSKAFLIIHGTHDETVPVAAARQLAAWNPGAELYLVDHANHTFGGQHPFENSVLPEDSSLIISRTIDFFKEVD